MMSKDPIVEEIRGFRREIERRFGNDPKRLLEYIYREQQEHPERLVIRKSSSKSPDAARTSR